MIDLKQLQKDIYKNKLNKGFNVTDINKEFCLTYGEMAEAYEAWRKKKDDLGEELADVAIYLLGLSEILNIDLEDSYRIGFIGIDENKVEMLFIKSKYFKKGIGKKLLEYVIKNHNINELDVNEQNQNAVNFYKYMGFEVINRSEKDGFGKPFPLLHMKLNR